MHIHIMTPEVFSVDLAALPDGGSGSGDTPLSDTVFGLRPDACAMLSGPRA
jgi:hypothetical protein